MPSCAGPCEGDSLGMNTSLAMHAVPICDTMAELLQFLQACWGASLPKCAVREAGLGVVTNPQPAPVQLLAQPGWTSLRQDLQVLAQASKTLSSWDWEAELQKLEHVSC